MLKMSPDGNSFYVDNKGGLLLSDSLGADPA